MKKMHSLEKVLRLSQRNEQLAFEKYMHYQNEISKGEKTLFFLQECLKEYNEKLNKEAKQQISAHEYQRFKYFIAKLEEAQNQQLQEIAKLQPSYQETLSEYNVLKKQSKQIADFIHREQYKINLQKNRKEQEILTALYNILNTKTSNL